ncbi:MAG: DUF4446 family protein [Patescibacteria group bacterium]
MARVGIIHCVMDISIFLSSPYLIPTLAGISVIFLVVWLIRLEIRIGSLLGKNAGSIEEAVEETRSTIKKVERVQRETLAYLEGVEKRLQRSVQGIETVRFNPFKGQGEGGNQSFSTAFINEEGDGVMLSSLYSRDRVSLFSKPLKKFSSPYELSDEEKEALNQAKARIQNGE